MGGGPRRISSLPSLDQSRTTVSEQTPSAQSTDSEPKRAAKPTPSAARRLGRGVLEVVFVLVLAMVITTGVRAFVIQMFVIPSSSMENTLQVGDRVVVSRMTDVKRGQVVVFKDPGGWLPPAQERTTTRKALEFIGVWPNSSQQYLIKRLIGMPGDTVKCCTAEGQLSVNGVALDESSYLKAYGDQTVEPAKVPFEVVVPAGRVFVMGDNRSNSQDSRCHLADISVNGTPPGDNAFVPLDDVVGAAVAIVAPMDRIQRLRTPAVFSAIPAPSKPAPAQATIIPAGVGCQ